MIKLAGAFHVTYTYLLCDFYPVETFKLFVFAPLPRLFTLLARDSSGSRFDLRTLRAVRVLRPLKLVSGIPSTYMDYSDSLCASSDASYPFGVSSVNSVFSLGITDSDQNHFNAYVVVINNKETMILSGLILMSLFAEEILFNVYYIKLKNLN